MKKIYSIGEVLVDMMMTDFPCYEAKFGGAPANVAMNLAKFKGKSYFLGNVGVDHLGQSLYQSMQKVGIDLSYVTQSGKTTLAFVSWDEKGERDFQFYSESDQDYHLPASLKLSKDDMVHFGGATAFLKNDLEKAYWDLFHQAVDKQAFISFDPNYRQDLITDLDHFKKACYQMIDKADLIKLSLEEAAVLYGTTDYQDLEKKMNLNEKQILLVTLGEAGAYLAYQNRSIVIESIVVDQVDTTGAGDAFVSAVLYQLAKLSAYDFADMMEVVTLANKVGALTTTQYGAVDAVPDIADLL